MKKTLRSVLTLLLVVMMALGAIAPVVGYAAESVPAPQSTGGSDGSSYDAGWLEIERVGDELIVTLVPDIESAKQIDTAELKEILNEILGHAKDIVINSLKDDILNGQYGDGEEGFTDLDSVWTTAFDTYLERSGYDSGDYVGFFEGAESDDTLIDGLVDYTCSLLVAAHQAGIVDNETLESFDVEAAIDAAFDAKFDDLVLAELEEIILEYTDRMVDGYEETVSELADIDTEITLFDIIGYVDEVTINGYAIYGTRDDGKGTEIKLDNIAKILATVPNFYEISKMDNDEMEISLDVAINTIFDSTSEITLTGKIGGGYDYVRSVAGLISKYVSLEYKNGQIIFDLEVPAVLSKALLKAANTDLIDPAIKHKVFAAFMADGNDVYALIQELSFDDLITLLECVDFEGILDKEVVKEFVDLSGYTNEEIIAVVKRYEKYFNVALKYTVRIADKVVSVLPEKYMNVSVLDILEYEDSNDKFTYSDGTFGYEGTHTVPFEYVERGLNKAAELLKLDEAYVSVLLAFIPEKFVDDGFTVSADITVDFAKINRVDYVVKGETVRSGFLPAGADVAFFANVNDPDILFWIDQDLKKVTKMPDCDVVLTAVYNDGEAYPSADIDKVYDAEPETVGVFITETERTFTYEWYKDGEILPVTNSSFEVVNVADSGVYTYKVYSNGKLTHEGEVKVNITPAKIDTSDVALKNDIFEYDGSVHTPELVGVPTGVSAIMSSDASASEAGKHTLTVTFVSDDPNYVADPVTLSFDWYIKNYIDLSGLEWHWPIDKNDPDNESIPVYNGSKFEVYLSGISAEEMEKLVFVLSGNNGTDAGDYLAAIESVSVKGDYADSYMIVGNEDLPTLEWRIDPISIHLDDLVWGSEVTFGYDGKEHGVYLEFCPDELVPHYTGNVNTNAGSYVASVTFTYADERYENNYEIIGKVPELNWSITPAVYDVSGLEWTVSDGFAYNGKDYTVEITTALPSYVNVKSYSGATGKAVGSYTAVATLESTDTNYVLSAYTVEHSWSIVQGIITVTDINWNYTADSLIYNGSEQCVTPEWLLDDETLRDLVIATVTGNTGTDAKSDYSASITFTCSDDGYIVVVNDGEPTTLTWAIDPKVVNVSGIKWDYTNAFTYTGSSITVNLDESTIPEGVDVECSNNSKTDAGNYTAIATVTPKANYVIEGTVENCNWEIKAKVVNVSGIEWDYTDAFTYNGSDFTVSIVDGTLPEGVSVSYENNKFKDAGNYTAKATLTPQNSNYEVLSGESEITLNWVINKAAIDGSGIVFEDKTVDYNGQPHSIEVSADADILELLNIVYSGNGQVEPGTYTVVATITVKSEYAGNYTYVDELSATLTINSVNPDKKTDHELTENGEVIVKIEASNGLDPDNVLSGGVTTDVEPSYEVDGRDASVLVAYDIFFTENGAVVSVDGQTFTVRLLIPEKYRGYDADELQVIHIKDDGSVEVMESNRDGDYMVFETTHFSVYAIVLVESPSLLWLWILLAVILVVAIAIGVYFLLRNKKDKTPALDAIPQAAVEPVKEPSEEAPAEETPVEEEPVIEENEEIPEVDEVVEEDEEEEIPEIDEVVLVTEEEPVEEEPVEEEPVEEEPVEEEPTEEAPVSTEPKTAVLVMGEDGKEATAIIGGEVVHIRFRSSFMSRLIQSTENIQDFYSTIKNHVLSYKGIKARGSWNYEAFNKGRIQLVKLNIKGKTLIVNLNLDPKEFNINKYHFIDCSDKPKFAKVPMMMKVRSARALKYTLELIDEMMAKYELTQGEVPGVDYRMPYETTEELAKRGLVKVILPAGVTLSDDMTFVHVNVSELIESGTSEKTTEQLIITETPVEEAPVEETPVEEAPVEEAPVEEAPVEEAPVEEAPVEEAPVEEAPVEETPVEEAPVEEEPKAPVVQMFEDGTVHADAEVADQLISDEEAEAKIEIVTVEAAKRAGKMGEINLDVICENFDDGDVVDVESLKAKRLVSPKIARIKVLARGIMYKKLTVKASKFSLQAVKMITLAGGKVELEE